MKVHARSSRLEDIQPAMLEMKQVFRDIQLQQVIHVIANVS